MSVTKPKCNIFSDNYQEGYQFLSENYQGLYQIDDMIYAYYQFSPENHQKQYQVPLKNHQEFTSLIEGKVPYLNDREVLLN
ncbi:15658_t:CDS:2, partial [Gigaspora margarita]